MNLVVGTPKIPILKPQTIDDVFCYKWIYFNFY
jgi:hypothetical protein